MDQHNTKSFNLTKIRKYFFRGLGIVVGLILLLMIAVFSYVSLNKKKIIRQVTAEISRKINGNISIGNIELSFFRDFPNVSVLLHDVRVTDTMFFRHKHPFLEAKDVFARLNIGKLIKKEAPLKGIRINRGSLYLYTDSSGYSNNYLIKQKKKTEASKTASAEKNELKSIELNDFAIVINDEKKNKLHDLLVKRIHIDLDDQDSRYILLNTDANVLIHGLGFNLARGTYIKEKKLTGTFTLRYNREPKQLQFDSINIRLGDNPFNMTGRFDLSGDAPQFNFRVHAKDILFNSTGWLLPERITRSLSIVTIDNPLSVSAFINGPLKGGDPLVNITWTSNEVRLATPFLDFDEAKFTGYFTNEVVPGLPRKDPNSKIVINNLSALWHSLPVHANNIEIMNLSDPTLSCDLNSQFPLTTLNELIGAGSLEFASGEAAVDITYRGPLKRTDSTNSLINGSILFKNGSVLYTPRNVEMEQLNATLLFKNSDLFIDNLQTVVLKNKFVMHAVAKNLLTLIRTGPNNIKIDWDIYSPGINLNPFTFLLAPKKTVQKKGVPKKAIANMASAVDEVLDKGRLDVQLKTPKLSYRKFEAQNVIADVSLLSDRYFINKVSMNHSGGSMNIQGSMVPGLHKNLTSINMTMNNVDVNSVFTAFENFGQDGITDQNLSGLLTAKINTSLLLNENGKVDPSSLAGTVDFSLKDGTLNSYEPVKKLQRFIFKKRDFENIRFAELKNRLDIKDREITINRMEIQSSVLSMFVEGVYSQKGNTDISIQVPLNNLKKRDSTYNPENIGIDKKGGKSIFLRGRPGEDGTIKFKLDLLHKYGKEKKEK